MYRACTNILKSSQITLVIVAMVTVVVDTNNFTCELVACNMNTSNSQNQSKCPHQYTKYKWEPNFFPIYHYHKYVPNGGVPKGYVPIGYVPTCGVSNLN